MFNVKEIKFLCFAYHILTLIFHKLCSYFFLIKCIATLTSKYCDCDYDIIYNYTYYRLSLQHKRLWEKRCMHKIDARQKVLANA